MNGENDFGAVSPPLGPCECRKVNVARNVQDICYDRAGLPNNVPSVQPAFAEVRCFDPPRFGFLRPGIGNLLKRRLNAEVAECTFFAEEPGDAHLRAKMVTKHDSSILNSRFNSQ